MPAPSVWSVLASRWEDLFPLRPARVEMCCRLSPRGGAVLDAGCGTGSLVRALLAAERDAWGFDLDQGFVEESRGRLEPLAARVVQADLREVGAVFADRRFDLVVCLGQTFPHLLSDADVRVFLEGARTRLAPDGVLSLQVVSDERTPVERKLPDLDVAGLHLERRRILVSADRAVLELRAATPDGAETWTVEHRRWTPEALSEAARGCGLRVRGVAADESGSPWTGTEAGWVLELENA